MIEAINPIIRGWGNYYRKAHVRKLFHRLDGWIERRLRSFVAKKWRNAVWRLYPLSRLVQEFGLVRLIYLVPGIKPGLEAYRMNRSRARSKTMRPRGQSSYSYTHDRAQGGIDSPAATPVRPGFVVAWPVG